MLCIGFMALVSTSAFEAARQHVLQHAGMSRFMNGSPPVKPIAWCRAPSRAISSR